MVNKTIGLCLSGGGHRASIFSLGALLYLVDAERHRDITSIASVSGGSLTSVFLAVQPKSLHQMNRGDFNACAAHWARQIAGSPAWWRAAIGVQFLLYVAWVLLICAGWRWLHWWPWVGRYWWNIQLVYLIAVCVWASIVGSQIKGTFWGWWGTWIYLGILAPALFLLLFVWWSPLPWIWRVLSATLAALSFAARARIGDLAFRATVCGRQQLRNIWPAPCHVFCATEMQTGKHAYFSRGFIYSDGAGLGRPHDLALSTAVQSSANFPVAFPNRVIPFKKHDFQFGMSPEFLRKRKPSLVLSDGGVHDNTGISWFLEASQRKARLRWFLESAGSGALFASRSIPDEVRRRIEERLAAMGDSPDILLIVNSSPPNAWSETQLQTIPAVGEALALYRVQAAMYQQRGREQSRDLHRRFFNRSLPGAMVSIERHPSWPYLFLNPERNLPELYDFGLSDLPTAMVEQYRLRAESMRATELFGPDVKPESLALLARRRELLERKRQLRARQVRADAPPAEEKSLEAEMTENRAQVDEIDERLRVSGVFEKSRDTWDLFAEAESASKVATTFRPLGARATTDLLFHGYMSCMKMCHFLLEGFPRFDDPPSMKELGDVARGIPRTRYPVSVHWREVAVGTS